MPTPTVDELMARWQQAREAGTPLSPEELCRDCPDLLPELQARLATVQSAVEHLPATATATPAVVATPGRHPSPPLTLPPAADAPPPDLSFLQPARGPGELGRLGPYRVLAVLGQGGLGITLCGEDATSRHAVTLKAMYPDLAKDATIREHFLREARNAATLDHPRLVHVLSVDEANGVPYLVTPALKGEPLIRRLGSRPLPTGEVVRLGKAIAAALEAVHVRGLAHRDLKPGNVWLEPDGQVLLLDYGLARSVADSPEHSRDSRLIGVAAYLAPEQLRDPEKADRRADFFALGCLLYEMATGRRAFPGETLFDVQLAIRSESPPDPLTVNPELPRELAWLVKSLLHKEPARRPETARQVLNKLEEIERHLALPKRAEPLPPSRAWLWVLVAALALGAAAAWWLWPR